MSDEVLISVISDQGVRFNVRVVRKGERYGRRDNGVPCLVHNEVEPLVEFYDSRYKIDGEIGQFVSRYRLSTLAGDEALCARGLCLDGGVPEWSIDGVAFTMVRRALKEVIS